MESLRHKSVLKLAVILFPRIPLLLLTRGGSGVVLNGLALAVESVVLDTSWELGLSVGEALLDGLAGNWGAEWCRSTENGTRAEHGDR